MPKPRPCPSALIAAVLAAALAGCGASDDVAAPAASVEFTAGSAPVVIPGSPGEPTRTVAPGETGSIENPGRWNEADVEFVTRMVPHHAQALEMAALAPERSTNPQVLSLAERITAAQGPEIDAMQGWLAAQGLPAADPDDHGHHGMQGMVDEAGMLQLRAAQGEEFDRLFLELMTEHHEGAIAMAGEAGDATNPVVTDLAADVSVGQQVEIERMAELLAGL